MSLADRLTATPEPKPCKAGLIEQALPVEDREALRAAMGSDMATAAICDALRREGHPISRSTVRAHRQGACSCGTSRHPGGDADRR
jgi:hypothetical protein